MPTRNINALADAQALGWADLPLARDAANTLAQRNGVNAQAFNLYKTYTSSTSNERLALDTTAAGFLDIVAARGSLGGAENGIRIGGKLDGGSFVPWLTFATNGNVGIGTSTPTYSIDVRGTTSYPANVARFLGPSDLDALNVRVVSGVGAIWESAAGYGALNIRCNSIRFQDNSGSPILTIPDSAAWSDSVSTHFISRGVSTTAGGLEIAPSNGAYERVHLRTKGMVVDDTEIQFTTTPPNALLDLRSPSASRKMLILQGAVSQTASLLEWWNSAGDVLASVSALGQLNLRASTTAADTAPIRLTTGVLQTTPQAGAIEYDGTNLYFTDSGGTRRTLAVV